ncbi:uncharacterized protein [Procambarus clarkii]
MDRPVESALTMCEFEGRSSLLLLADDHSFCLRHAACWDEDQDNSEIDYSSLSGLMSALATNGVNVVPDYAGNSEFTGNHEETGGTESSSFPLTTVLDDESSRQRLSEAVAERAVIWNSSPTSDRLILDGNKVEEIKSVMASFTLPQSAIPAWAQNLSEEDWKDQVAGLIARRTSQ